MISRPRWLRLATRLAGHREFVPPGHFYSPIPSVEDIRARELEIFDTRPTALPGIELREAEQAALVGELVQFAGDASVHSRSAELRYSPDNDNFGPADALVLQALLRHARPRRVVEIGSGWSTAVMLDTNDRFLDGALDLTVIDPYPERLESLLRASDRGRVTVLRSRLQDASDDLVGQLEHPDVVFVDSSHVSKVDSDVNHVVFRLLPALPAGTWIHFHDVFFPFEYPRDWVYDGRAWNEAYFVRAFLSFNDAFRIRLWPSLLAARHGEALGALIPRREQAKAASLWLQRAGGPAKPEG